MTQPPDLDRLAARANTAAKTLANVRDDLARTGVDDETIVTIAQDATLRASHVASLLAYRATQTRTGVPA